jgi:hypothetical protein
MDRDARAREIQASIREVFNSTWDPIGVLPLGVADEYDSYVGGVYRLLASGTSAPALSAHLQQIEQRLMGLPSTPEYVRARAHTVEQLMALNVGLEAP